jgi:NosR/NirI family nitrous oxide reductase transcriptional regulator
MRRNLAYLVVLLAPLAGGGVGYVSAPALARTNDTVRLAARVWKEDRLSLAERTLESEAFRLTGGADRAALFGRAQAKERQFRVGGLLFGLWCGLVVGLKVFSLSRPTRRTEFEVDHAWCVSCGRCYRWCPRERQRLKPWTESSADLPG